MQFVGTSNTRKTQADTNHLAQQWRYTDSKRDLRLDFIRGLAVIVMVIDHVGGDNSWLYTLTGDNHFFISAAEPFVFVSGLVMGLVYSSLIARLGLRAAAGKALKRSGFLYVLDVLLSVALALLSL